MSRSPEQQETLRILSTTYYLTKMGKIECASRFLLDHFPKDVAHTVLAHILEYSTRSRLGKLSGRTRTLLSYISEAMFYSTDRLAAIFMTCFIVTIVPLLVASLITGHDLSLLMNESVFTALAISLLFSVLIVRKYYMELKERICRKEVIEKCPDFVRDILFLYQKEIERTLPDRKIILHYCPDLLY